MKEASRLDALANPKRLAVLRWLKHPARHFPAQPQADVETVGVSCTALTNKLHIAPATTTRHMQVLARAGFVRARRIGKFTYYLLVEGSLEKLAADLVRFQDG
jgi:ArsR family transcriptional regulator